MDELLQLDEQQQLLYCEKIIEKGFQTFVEVGNALNFIRTNKLYKQNFRTFEEYCRVKWAFQRQYANRLIAASETVANLVPIGTIPDNEAQIRPLTNLEPEAQRQIWAEVIKESEETGKPITGKSTNEFVKAWVESNDNPQANRQKRKSEKLEKDTAKNPITPDQQQRIDDLNNGKTVVLNLNTDQHLKKFALDKNLLVRCDGVSTWGNPFTVDTDGTYEEVKMLYKEHYLPFKKNLHSRIHELKGKALGCFCYPEPCHCDVLKDWVERGG